jgi:hypothetical protein
MENFSKSQMKKKGARRCKVCVAAAIDEPNNP